MKRLFCFLTLALACVGHVLAWEPVIKETHWFTLLEDYSGSPYTMDAIDFDGNYIRSISGWKHWDGQQSEPNQLGNHHHPKISYYSWLDHQYRFKVNRSELWIVDKNNSTNYSGPGLKNNRTDGEGTNFWILNLKQGDKFNIEYYRNPGNNNSPFLVSGSVDGLTPANNYSAANAIYGANENGLVYYTMAADGDVEINIPAQAVIRSVSIIHKEYKKATYETKQITDNGNIGYETTLTGSGVLEDKRGAVPYITMRFGNENDQTFVRDLGEAYGARRYGAAGIVNENNDFNFSSAGLQNRFINMSTDQVKKLLANKEWTVFTCEQEPGNKNQGKQDNFNSIYPLYGSYYYFFPEVDGKLNVKFYCEGEKEHMAFWYKRRADGTFPDVGEQPSKISPSSNDNSNNSNYYEYTVNVEKGGVYYLCSNPTIVEHQQPIIRLVSYSFVPTFRVDPLYSVVGNGSQQAHDAATIKGVTIAKFTGINGNVFKNDQKITINGDENAPMIKFLGNVTGATISLRQSGNDIKLDFDNITYKSVNNINKGGAIVVNLDCPAGRATYVLTVAYKAAKAEWGKDTEGNDLRVATNETGNVEVKKWDFFSKSLAVGTYGTDDGARYDKDKDEWLAKSLLFREVHKADGLTADWVNTYVDVENKEEPIFKSVYDMEGDNADMLEETNGLIFLADANELGIYNENPESSKELFQDRYIGFIGGGEMWIPNLEAGDRIVMKMGRYGKDSQGADKAHLTITGAKDAIGTDITGDYVIGGSGVATGNDLNGGADITDKSQPWGEYHFISTGGHFKLEVTDATLLKLYSIVIYKHDDTILTENQLLGDEEHRQILNTAEFTRADNVQLRMRYRGLNEATNYSADPVAMTGNLQASDVNITDMTSDQSLWYVYSVALPSSAANAKFGVFKARQGVQTIGEDYVTDYADCMIPVGYRETKEYPYTWDFTDLKKYVSAGIDNNGVEKEVADTDADLRIWNNWNLRVKPEEWDGNIFVSGGQLYGGKTMFDETRGLGITHDNTNVALMTGDGTDLSGGLSIGNGAYGFIVPQVGKNEAIYVRAHKVGSTQKASYEQSDGTTTYAYGSNEQDFTYSATATDGDEVFAVVMPSSLTKKVDVKLSFQGYEVKKIAVSTDQKAVNVKGYASESRARAIDHALTSYFTGEDIKAYVVSSADYENRTLTLTNVGSAENHVLDANQGCVIYAGTPELDVLDGGFHFFVPDMHDGDKVFSGDNLMKENIAGNNIDPSEGDFTNYILTYKYYQLDKNGNKTGSQQTGDEMFYRVANGGATAKKNSAYLQLLTSKVKPSEKNPTGSAKFTFIFSDFSDDNTPTAIESLSESDMQPAKNAIWYNMNGQKLNGKPQQGGLYIVNGKKVLVK